MKSLGLSERRSCKLAGVNRSTCRYRKKRRDDDQIRKKIKELAVRHPRFGTPRITVFIRKEFGMVNHKKVERIYSEEGLQLPRKRKKRRYMFYRKTLKGFPTRPNERWSLDFMTDSTSSGRKFRVLNIVDDYTREYVGVDVGSSLTGERVVRKLKDLKETRGLPETLMMDNGSEFTSKAMILWCKNEGINMHFIDPGKPVQNAYIESFNGKFRDECLNLHWFESINEARDVIERWRDEYNTIRPHSSLGHVVPVEFRNRYEKNNTDDKISQKLSFAVDQN